MNSLVQHIEYLLTRHDCVVVPGVGAFLNIYHSAWFDAASSTFHAPSVTVGFNPQINHNDWLLADSFSRRSGITREAALDEVHDAVRGLLFQLKSDGEVSLGNIGSLRESGGETPVFIPELTDFASDYAGLPSVDATTVDDSTEVDDSQTDEFRPAVASGVVRFIRIAACFILLIAAGVFFFIHSDRVTDDRTQYASIESGFKTYAILDALFAGEKPEIPELLIASRKHDVSAPAKPVRRTVTNQPDTALRLDGSDPYLVIVASFATRTQAETFLKQHSGQRLGVCETDGNFRIYVASAQTLSGANTSLQSPAVTARFNQAWILRR